jgi:hypothetical protein
VLAEAPAACLEAGPGVEPAALEALRSIAARDGLPMSVELGPPAPVVRDGSPKARMSTAGLVGSVVSLGRRVARTVVRRARRLARRLLAPTPWRRPERRGGRRSGASGARKRTRQEIEKERALRHAALTRRFEALATEQGRLLVVLEHAEQRVEVDGQIRTMNAYLGPVADQLRGTPLEPMELDIRARVKEDAGWLRFSAPDHPRLLTIDTLGLGATEVPDPVVDVDAIVDAIREAPVEVAGVDLGPELRSRVVATTRTVLPNQLRSRDRIRWVLRRLRPAGILLADEYHRQDWLAAAAAEGIPTIALQHGMIYRHHNGYIHPARPAGLRLPDRTYVFGRWERELLVHQSVYREDEVRVGGSPRLDLVRPDPTARDAMRAELGVTPGERVVVVSGSWGSIYRGIHYPICLAGLMDLALPDVHIVVKLHPGEQDEGPYRAVIERAAAARGLPAPRITIVQKVDLYRLLVAADAHLGVHSTVLTEAVVTGTPNLLADSLAAADLLGYVDAGVATPVRDGGDVLAALDRAAADGTLSTPEARAAFVAQHFEPGCASERIAGELLGWLR